MDSTTNPSLIFKAAEMPEYNDLIMKALASRDSNEARPFSSVVDQLVCSFCPTLCCFRVAPPF